MPILRSLVLITTLGGCVSALPSQTAPRARRYVVDSSWVPIRIDRPKGGVAGPDDQGPNVLRFRNGRQMTIQLFQVEFLGQLPRAQRAPVLLLGARGCYSCDVETQVYPVPADAPTYDYGARGAYYYPGSLSPAEPPPDTVEFYRGRMFIGECLADRQPVVVWFEQQRDTSGAWKEDVYRLRVRADSVEGEFLKPRPPLGPTLRAVKAGRCFEVAGLEQAQG
jgi:hypothetical protein